MNVVNEITGSVWKILVSTGDQVAEGDVLLLIESMKMEVPVPAERSGRVASVTVKEGEAITEGQVLAVIDPV